MLDATHRDSSVVGDRRPAIHVILAAVLSLVVAGAAFALSFAALADLARLTGVFPEPLPVLLPIVIDVFMIQASYSLVVAAAANDTGSRHYHWCVLAVSSCASIVLNCYHAWVASGSALPAAVSATIASIPPLALLASTHGLIVHLSPTTVADTSSASAQDAPAQVEAVADNSERDEPVHAMTDTPASIPEPADSVHPAHETMRDVVIVITDAHMAQARLLKSEGRLTRSEGEVARVLALRDAGYSPREIESLLPGIGVRTTIARWLQAADELFRADEQSEVEPPAEPSDEDSDWTLTPA